MAIHDTIALGRFTYDAGTSGTVTVPTGKSVRRITALGAANATLTITPGGANQPAVVGAAIPLPSTNTYWTVEELLELGPGTVLAFVNTVSYFVEYRQATN